MVGAVLVFEGRVIGEGFHQEYGKAHAEVNCLASVNASDRQYIRQSTLYVSLEPCAHFGKTPPCADLIISEGIPRVVIGCRDPFPEVAGKGIEKLEKAGVSVHCGILEIACRELNKRFFCLQEKRRPYIILKWAESVNGAIAAAGNRTVAISNNLSNRLVHRWRTEEAAIVVGIGTVLADDPLLTSRLWPGKNPLRVLFDRQGRAKPSSRIFSDDAETLWLKGDETRLPNALAILAERRIDSLLVEGGSVLLQAFLDQELWDEIRIIQNESLVIPDGLPAPRIKAGFISSQEKLEKDRISYYHAAKNSL